METNHSEHIIFNWIIPTVIIVFIVYLFFRTYKQTKSFAEDLEKSGPDKTAGFLSRFFALWIDLQLFSFLNNAILILLPVDDFVENGLSILISFLFVLYKIGSEYKNGQTIGKTLLGIQVVPELNTSLQLVHIIKRNIYYLVLLVMVVLDKGEIIPLGSDNEFTNLKIGVMIFLILIPILINFLWYFMDNKGLTLQDKFGSVKVVKVSPLHRYFWWFIVGMIIISFILNNYDKFLSVLVE